MQKSRLIGGYPVIGIRPVIDGRRGPMKFREGLEEQTMAMAHSAKTLFEENLKLATHAQRVFPPSVWIRNRRITELAQPTVRGIKSDGNYDE